MTGTRTRVSVWAALAVLLATTVGCLLLGSVDIPAADVWRALTGGELPRESWRVIVCETRVPATLTAMLAGASLAVAGLLMQTTFDNPLAGPSILGISTGASLGVAVVMLAAGTIVPVVTRDLVLVGALIGALAVMGLLLAMSSLVRSATMLLIVGILIGYLASSAIALLNFFSSRDGVHSYVIWGLGNFGGVRMADIPLFAGANITLILASLLCIKPLNALLLGQQYAESAGVNVRLWRNAALLISGALTAAVTAWCGPVGFIGLVVPHIARLALHTSNHRSLLPVTAVFGAAVGVMCQLLSVAPGQYGVIPVNAITPVIGVPVIIYIIVCRRSIFYFR
ncbi:MAG: iron ABC transporter permease [Bacteroidales bacterium]|nr:iron ABC transporter permease [Bacteroidales bacterium]